MRRVHNQKANNSMHSVDYGSAIGSLQYLSCTTRPDIAFAVGQLASFTSDPGVAHWNAIKHLFRYIQGSIDFGITYSPDSSTSEFFSTFSNANHGGLLGHMWSRLVLELCPGCQSASLLLLCRPLKLSMWLHARLARRLSGCAN